MWWTLAIVLRHLYRLGHKHADPKTVGFFGAFPGALVEERDLREPLASYQAFHRLPVTATLDDATMAHLKQPRCAHPDVMADEVCVWPIRDLTYFQSIAYPGVDPARIAANYAEAAARFLAGRPDLTAIDVTDPGQARVVATQGPIDGPGNIVALTELPCGYTADSVCHQTFDVADGGLLAADDELMIACMCHEWGHVWGLGHSTDPNDIMYPILNPNVSSPSAGDVAKRDGLYPPPVVPPPAPTWPWTDVVTIESAGVDDLTLHAIDFPAAGQYRVTIEPVTSSSAQ